jgi:hypothetical protein
MAVFDAKKFGVQARRPLPALRPILSDLALTTRTAALHSPSRRTSSQAPNIRNSLFSHKAVSNRRHPPLRTSENSFFPSFKNQIAAHFDKLSLRPHFWGSRFREF